MVTDSSDGVLAGAIHQLALEEALVASDGVVAGVPRPVTVFSPARNARQQTVEPKNRTFTL